jgi:hypothetical protein
LTRANRDGSAERTRDIEGQCKQVCDDSHD